MVCSQLDLEWLVTYNGIGYDLPYLYIRAMYLECRRFLRMGRFLAVPEEKLNNPWRHKQCLMKAMPKMGMVLSRYVCVCM